MLMFKLQIVWIMQQLLARSSDLVVVSYYLYWNMYCWPYSAEDTDILRRNIKINARINLININLFLL